MQIERAIKNGITTILTLSVFGLVSGGAMADHHENTAEAYGQRKGAEAGAMLDKMKGGGQAAVDEAQSGAKGKKDKAAKDAEKARRQAERKANKQAKQAKQSADKAKKDASGKASDATQKAQEAGDGASRMLDDMTTPR